MLFVVWRVPLILVFTVLSAGFPYFTNVVQLLCSFSGWLHLNCSSTGAGFNGAETNCRISHNLGILLMKNNCFAIFFSSILIQYLFRNLLSIRKNAIVLGEISLGEGSADGEIDV